MSRISYTKYIDFDIFLILKHFVGLIHMYMNKIVFTRILVIVSLKNIYKYAINKEIKK
jgi:hypothetical protein